MDRSLPKGATEPQPSGGASLSHRYDRVSISLHWLTAGLVIALFLIAEGWGFLDRADREPLKLAHTSLGVLLAAVIVARVTWRLFLGNRVAPANAGLMQVIAKFVHLLLYVLIAVQVSLGFLASWSGRKAAVSFFGLDIPSPFAAFTREDHHFFEEVHGWVAWAIIIIALGHAVAALVHHYVLRDNLIARMMPSRA